MPKLSQDALSKMFQCEYCGDLLRTRQGLSGHIQFKHTTGQGTPNRDYDYLNSKASEFRKYGLIILLPESEIAAHQNALKRWPEVQTFCQFLGLKLGSVPKVVEK